MLTLSNSWIYIVSTLHHVHHSVYTYNIMYNWNISIVSKEVTQCHHLTGLEAMQCYFIQLSRAMC